jgi:hypothetical protein
MKKIILSILTLGVLGITSCSSDPCKDKTAATQCNGKGVLVTNGSACDCQCDAGYEGTSCATLSTSKFVGTWAAIDNNTTIGSVGPYSSAITVGASVGTLTIGNFSNVGVAVNSTVKGNEITIPNQTLGTLYTVSGSGTFSTSSTGSSVIAMKYTIVKLSNSTSYPYTGTWTK